MRLLYAVVAAVIMLELVAIAHRAAGLDKVFGVYAPRYANGRVFVSPLMNANHAAAVAGIVPPVLMGLALDGKIMMRVLAAFGIAASGAVAILTFSRSGMLVFGLEMGVMTVYALMKSGSIQQRGARAGFAALAALGALAAAFLVGSEQIVSKATSVDASKLRVPLQAVGLSRDFFWTGVGRGAFEAAFPAYEGALPGGVRYTHVESWPMQLVSDFGVPFAVAFIVLLVSSVAQSKRAFVRPTYLGAVVALVGLVVHDVFDFAMEFAATAMLAAPLLAVVTTAGVRREAGPAPQARFYLPAAVALSVVVGGLALRLAWTNRIDDEQTEIATRLKSEHPDVVAPAIASALRRHPADPHFFALEGVRRLRDPEGGAFLVRAVELGPKRGMTHVWLARWFALHGRKAQAWAELRAALAVDPFFSAGLVVHEMVRLGADLPELEALASDTRLAGIVAAELEARGRKDDAEIVDASAIARFPPAIDARIRQIRRARVNDLERARRLAKELTALKPKSAEAWILASDLMPTDGEAERLLSEALRVVGDDIGLLETLVRRRATRLGLDLVASDVAKLQIAYELAGASPARLPLLKAKIELARKRPSAALRHYLDAAAAEPEQLSHLEAAAEIATSTGQLALAESLWTRLASMRPDEQLYRDRLQALRPTGAPPAVVVPNSSGQFALP